MILKIGGKELKIEEVRSSIARRLGIDTAGLVPTCTITPTNSKENY